MMITDQILEAILYGLIISLVLLFGFLALSLKSEKLKKYRSKALVPFLWIWAGISSFFLIRRIEAWVHDNSDDDEEILQNDLERNEEKFRDKVEKPDPPDAVAERGRALAERFRSRK